jgi:predicted transcriptional regulator
MYKAFLSYPQLNEYLSILMKNKLVEYQEINQTYKTTGKGLHFLQIYNQIRELLTITTL